MDDRLRGKVAIVTGAGSIGVGIGNGRATAVMLARAGATVVLVDANRTAADATYRMIRAENGSAVAVEADVATDLGCRHAVEAALELGDGRLDVLVNNVGVVGAPGTAEEVDPTDWDLGMVINIKSMMLMARYCIPVMRRTGGGSIVNVSSIAGMLGGHVNLLYPTTKAAVIGLTRSMACHHGADAIRVNCVAPGMVHTPMAGSEMMSAATRKKRRETCVLRSEGTAWDVAYAVLYLACDESRWVTGITLPVDGGLSATYVPGS